MDIFQACVVTVTGLLCFIPVTFACDPMCADAPGNAAGPICNATTLDCLYGCKGNFESNKCRKCKRQWTGDQCQYRCDYNCLECTWQVSGGTVETGCNLCYPEYFIEEQSRCSQCHAACLKNSSSASPTCNQVIGYCTFGCTPGWGGKSCNINCHPWCINHTCSRDHNACCEEGCRYNTYGGCRCQERCSSNCKNGMCYQNKTCMAGCELNHWGHNCTQTCSENCLLGPDNTSSVCDMNGVCLHGCKDNFRGQDCSNKCSDKCLERKCSQTDGACKLGCMTGFHGPFCSETCSEICRSTACYQESGKCQFGCKEGLSGKECDTQSCDPKCANAPGNEAGPICNATTLECLYGCKGNFEGDQCDKCKRQWTGNQCQYKCDYNCLECTWKESGGTVETGCNLCYPEYYYDEHSNYCAQCNQNCLRNSSSVLPTCTQMHGVCAFGCRPSWGGQLCDEECSAWCITPVCRGKDACCTEGCKYSIFGGCRCNEACSRSCKDGTCYQNKTCMAGCELNHWGHNCTQTCSENCLLGPDNSSSVCDMNGVCLYGCKDTFWGNDCSNGCSDKCLNTTCFQIDGACKLGCLTGFHGSFCSETCSVICRSLACYQDSGECQFGCKEGFSGEECGAHSCGPNCADAPGGEAGPICNTTTLDCLYGCTGNFEGDKCDKCKREWTGDQCQYRCDFNCLECTWNVPGGTVEIGCNLCYPEYYHDEQSNDCLQCNVNCLKNSSSVLPTCDQVHGECTFGCVPNWGGEHCDEQCHPWCSTPVCRGKGVCCTDGCKYNIYGGCRCDEACSSSCKNGTCYQNKTCMAGCELNHWGHNCTQTCSENCILGPDNSSSVCDMNGACLYGCTKDFFGEECDVPSKALSRHISMGKQMFWIFLWLGYFCKEE